MSTRSSATTSPGSGEPPEFYFDRSLGRQTARGLRELGWTVHLIADEFDCDAQDTADPTWVSLAGSRGWACLSKDHGLPKVAWDVAVTPSFILANANMRAPRMIDTFHLNKDRIWRQVELGGRGFWMAYEDGRPLHRRFSPSSV